MSKNFEEAWDDRDSVWFMTLKIDGSLPYNVKKIPENIIKQIAEEWFKAGLDSLEECWVDVNDELPDRQGHYLVACPRSFPKNYRGKIAEFYTDNNTFYCEYSDEPIEDVRYWMKAPETPNNYQKD